MKRLILVSVLALGVVGAVLAVLTQLGITPDAEAGRGNKHKLKIDVAINADTFRLSEGRTIDQAKRGDHFVVHGLIFPDGTLSGNDSVDFENPDEAIGEWICRGVFNFDMSEIMEGAVPHVTTTQIYKLDDQYGEGTALWSDGEEGGIDMLRAVIGGTGAFKGAGGEVFQETLGANQTGLFNLRFTFDLNSRVKGDRDDHDD